MKYEMEELICERINHILLIAILEVIILLFQLSLEEKLNWFYAKFICYLSVCFKKCMDKILRCNKFSVFEMKPYFDN